MQNGILYIVATPIGHLADFSLRGKEILDSVQFIAAEDTRQTKKLLQHYAINTAMLAYHDHNEREVTADILAKLQAGQSVALVSDAGTPLVSDPGYTLLQAAIAAGIRIVPVPGACSPIAALCASGLPAHSFSYFGFLPEKQAARKSYLHTLAEHTATLIFFESARRIVESLRDCMEVFGGQRRAVIGREISKIHETFYRSDLESLYTEFSSDSSIQRGEIVLLIAGAQATSDPQILRAYQLADLLCEDLPIKKAASIAAQFCAVRKNLIYDYLIQQKKTLDSL